MRRARLATVIVPLNPIGVTPGIATSVGAHSRTPALHRASFAALCGVAPLPASSGRTTGRHRLNRGGDRAANNALHMIVLTRKRYCPRTRAYVSRRTAEGLSNREITRCLKRYVAGEIYIIINPCRGQDHPATEPGIAA